MDITLEQVERLREKADISYEEAKAVLEEAGGSVLDALILLEKRGRIHAGAGHSAHYSTRTGGESGPSAPYPEPAAEPEPGDEQKGGFWHMVQDLLRRGLQDSLEVWRREELMVSIPLLISILLLILAFWICLPLLVLGLLLGCRYRLTGPDFDDSPAGETVNRAARTVGDTVEKMKDEAQRYFHENHHDKK